MTVLVVARLSRPTLHCEESGWSHGGAGLLMLWQFEPTLLALYSLPLCSTTCTGVPWWLCSLKAQAPLANSNSNKRLRHSRGNGGDELSSKTFWGSCGISSPHYPASSDLVNIRHPLFVLCFLRCSAPDSPSSSL